MKNPATCPAVASPSVVLCSREDFQAMIDYCSYKALRAKFQCQIKRLPHCLNGVVWKAKDIVRFNIQSMTSNLGHHLPYVDILKRALRVEANTDAK